MLIRRRQGADEPLVTGSCAPGTRCGWPGSARSCTRCTIPHWSHSTATGWPGVLTYDNVDALRFYQRRGFRLAALHAAAVDTSRATLKPEIPLTAAYGIPIRDELELDRTLERPADQESITA